MNKEELITGIAEIIDRIHNFWCFV